MPSCFFIGHADVPPEIYPHLLKAIEALVADNRVSTFYVGRYGAFDRLAIRALQQIKRNRARHPRVSADPLSSGAATGVPA